MADSDDEDELLVTFAVTSVAAAAATFMLDAAATTRQRKRRHRVWVNKYLQRRAQYGTYNSLMIDLLELDDVKFCNYVRMPPEEFNTLFSKVQPFITTKNTRFR